MDPVGSVRGSWNWFCGVNSTDLDSNGDFIHESLTSNVCFVDALDALPHFGFILTATVPLLVLNCFRKFRRKGKTGYLLRFPGHLIRWLISTFLLVCLFASLAEGILTDETYIQSLGGSQPHLYIPPITALVACIISLVYYHHMEVWQAGGMAFVSLLYYATAALGEIGKLINLIGEDYGSIEITRFDLTILQLICYSGLFLLDVNVIRLKVFCRRRIPQENLEDLKSSGPLFRAYFVNLASHVSFWWLNWVFFLGYKKSLEVKDLGKLPKSYSAERLHQQFKEEYQREMRQAASKGRQPSLGKVIFRIYFVRMALAGILKLLGDLAGLVGPICISGIVLYVTEIYYNLEPHVEVEPHFVDTTEFTSNGFVLITITFLATTFQFIAGQTSMYYTVLYGMCVRSSVQSMVYEKSLSLSTFATTGGDMTVGQITNHMSTDPMNLLYMFQFFHFLWTVPFTVSGVVYTLYTKLGTAALLGSFVYILVIPLQLGIASFMAKHQKRALTLADERLKHSNEILQGIKLLKSYGWEQLYLKVVEKLRLKELRSILRMNLSFGAIGFIVNAAPLIVTLVTFGTYSSISGEALTPDKAFASLALFNLLAVPLFMLPLVTAQLVNGIISTRRLQRFFMAQEVEMQSAGNDWRERDEKTGVDGGGGQNGSEETNEFVYEDDVDETTRMIPIKKVVPKGALKYGATNSSQKSATNSSQKSNLPPSVSIRISDGNFTWDKNSPRPILSNIDIEIPTGKLTIIIGAVGSGKSSLVSAIQGEMTTLSGSVQYSGSKMSVAYAAQKAWLMNATLQDNILFGEQFNFKRYKKTIDVCAMKPDIDILPGGDQTEIGEKGINLSGGQKQRISVARTVYSGRDIIILDDPLSALDVHVGSHVFQKAIVGTLLRKKQTVVLVTHQLQYLHLAHKIIVMEDGRVAHQGTLDDIIDESPELYSEYQQAVKLSESESESHQENVRGMSDSEKENAIKRQISREVSEETRTMAIGTKLIEEEEMEQGSVAYSVYLFYCRAVTWVLAICYVASYLASSGFTVGTNFWLATWSEADITSYNSTVTQPLSYYIAGYAALSFAGVLTIFIGSMLNVIGAYLASKKLHVTMLRNIIMSPMRFFDTTPIGRILNRLASDTEIMDKKLFQSINAVVYFTVGYLSGVIVNCIILPIFVIFAIPMTVCGYFVAKFYITTSRSLQRLDSVTKSPIFAHFSETLSGLPTIRAYSDQNRFYEALLKKLNVNNTAFLYLQSTHRWNGIRQEMIGAVGVLVAGFGTIISSINGTIEPSKVGLAVSYTIWVANFMKSAIRFAAEMEMQMNAIERVKEYTSVPNENYLGTEPPPDWPQHGAITMQAISVRYAAELEPVLKNISLTFRSGEKVGICGRTGSGKSSLTLALFRIIDTYKGRILIDDVDINSVPLSTLRQRLAIIPQDPILFNGTIRYNLDPEDTRSDSDVWLSLEISQLKETVKQMPKGLDSEVSEGGENFSVGQRQLFCLARAFLRRSRILIMDEATASIDIETDKILQEVVATVFADCTVLTIAHRVATILDSDTILTLSDGEVVEYDTPENLLTNPNSIFGSLVKSDK